VQITFSSFCEASIFARDCAKKSGATVRIDKDEDKWHVCVSEHLASELNARSKAEAQARVQQEAKRDKAVAEARREEEILEKYLDERRECYKLMTYEELKELWDNMHELSPRLCSEEVELLQSVLRSIIFAKDPDNRMSEPNRQAWPFPLKIDND